MSAPRRCRSASSEAALTEDTRRMLKSWLMQTEIGAEPSSWVQLATTLPDSVPHSKQRCQATNSQRFAQCATFWTFCIFFTWHPFLPPKHYEFLRSADPRAQHGRHPPPVPTASPSRISAPASPPGGPREAAMAAAGWAPPGFDQRLHARSSETGP